MEFEGSEETFAGVISALGGGYQVVLGLWWVRSCLKARACERYLFHWGYAAQFPVKIIFYVIVASYQLQRDSGLQLWAMLAFAAYLSVVYCMGLGMSLGLGTRFLRATWRHVAPMTLSGALVAAMQLLVCFDRTPAIQYVMIVLFSLQIAAHFYTLAQVKKKVKAFADASREVERVTMLHRYRALLFIFVALILLFVLSCVLNGQFLPSSANWAIFVSANECVTTVTLCAIKPGPQLLDIPSHSMIETIMTNTSPTIPKCISFIPSPSQ